MSTLNERGSFWWDTDPVLENKIASPKSVLGFGLEEAATRIFAKDSATSRNVLSHHGGKGINGDYRTFVEDLAERTHALSRLHYAILLIEIGIDPHAVKKYVLHGMDTFRIAIVLSGFGLLPAPSTA